MKSSKLRLMAVLALCAFIGACLVFLPVKEWLGGFLEWVRGLGNLGPVVLALAYIPACVLFIPGSLLTLGAGFVLGLVHGTIAVSLGSVAGVSAAFLAGRFLLRGWIEERVARNPKFGAIDQAVGREGFKIVLLTRLSPIFPFNLLNYAFGLTKVRFRSYFLASWIGMLPGTILYVYLGATVKDLTDLMAGDLEGGVGQKVLLLVGLLATVVVTVIITRSAKQALNKSLSKGETQERIPLEGATHA